MSKIGVIDYGMGNIHSVKKALERLDEETILITNSLQTKECKALILPGVGSFDPAMASLNESGLISNIKNWIKSGKSFLGICLGLQLLFEFSDEGTIKGLGIVKGQVKKIPQISDLRIPHIGWCNLNPINKNSLLNKKELNNWVYFVHSYYALPSNTSLISAYVNYGAVKLTAMIEKDNLLACQFHPEKSGKTGEIILRRWINSIQ